MFLQYLPILGEYGSEFSYFIPEPRNFSEVTRMTDDIKKPWLKATMKEIKNLINNHNFLLQETDKGEPMTPCMDFYKARIKSDRSIDKLKLRMFLIGDMKNE